jgi:hypothetical protein
VKSKYDHDTGIKLSDEEESKVILNQDEGDEEKKAADGDRP